MIRKITNSNNYYTINLIDDVKRGMIIIAPGGGYSHASPREAEPIAKMFNSYGYHTTVIYYREDLDLFPVPQQQVKEVFDYVKTLDCVDETKVLGCGFSAGAHLMLSTHFLGYANFNGLIMAYPVVSADKEIAHLGSFEWLLGPEKDNEELRRLVSVELQVKNGAPDLFLWTTYTDQAVPIENSFRLIDAYRKVNASCEFHLYPSGNHGLSLATEETSAGNPLMVVEHVQSWAMLVKNWLKLKY